MEEKSMSVKIKEASKFLDLKEEDLLVFVDKKILKPIDCVTVNQKDQYQFAKEELVRFKKEQARILAGLTEGKSEVFFWEKKLLILKNQLVKKKEQLAFLATKIVETEEAVGAFLAEADRGMFRIKRKIKKAKLKKEEAIKDSLDSFLIDPFVEGNTKAEDSNKEKTNNDFWSEEKETLSLGDDLLTKVTSVSKEKPALGIKEKIKTSAWGKKWESFFKRKQ